VIDPARARSDEYLARFRREARAASRVESDHIVQVFDVGHDETFGLYMVMEYLSGEDLSARLLHAKRLDLATTLTIGYQLAETLAKAHAAGVVHRDLKPANIFLQQRGDGAVHAKILDFGISKIELEHSQSSDGPDHRKLTRGGSALGTPQYMSPEQAQGLSVDHRTDVWALGAVLYECLAGVQAYEERSSYEQMIIQIVTTRPRPLAEVAPWVPPLLADTIHRALAAELDHRIPDCTTLARRLLEAAPPGMSIPGSSSRPPPVEESRPKAVVHIESGAGNRVDDSAPTLLESETPPPHSKGQAKGLAFLHDEQYILDKYGREAWARVLASLAPGDAEVRSSIIAVGWYDSALFVRTLCAIDNVLRERDPKIVESLGRYAAEHDLKRIHRVFLRLANPAFVLEKAMDLWKRFFSTGRWDERRVERGAEAELVDWDAAHELTCRNLLAYLHRMFELVGAKGVTSRHPECRARGDARCFYSVRWQ
jgi:serine/threonine protein kinase